MEVIRNEPSCYNAACHVHTKAQSVLGVLDIVYSLDHIDRDVKKNTMTIAGGAVVFVLLASLLVSLFVHRLIYVPLTDLESGARRMSSGDLDQGIPVRSNDEFGHVAEAFNAMTVALKNSQGELREWGRTLEEKVAKRTSELRIAEAEATRSEKLASVGLLAAGIAHELNNPLTGVLTFAHLLRKKTPDGSEDAEDLDLVIRETKRCAAIIRRLLDFAREKKPETKKVESLLQMGIGAGKKHLKTAVARNRIKRLTREAFRLQKHELSRYLEEKKINISVFLVFTGTELADFTYIQNSIGKVMRTLQIRISEKATKNT